MADDVAIPVPAAPAVDPPAPPTPATPSPEVAELRAEIAALNDTVRAALAPRQPVNSPGGGGPLTIQPQLRAALRQQGLTDADIDHNAPLILPFVMALAPDFVGLVESSVGAVNERLSSKELEENDEGFPYARLLRKERTALVADGKKNGRPLSIEAAYHTAVSLNMEKCREHDETKRASSRGTDAAALSGIGHRAAASGGTRAARPSEPQTRDDLARLSREDRQKFWDSVGDRPIQ